MKLKSNSTGWLSVVALMVCFFTSMPNAAIAQGAKANNQGPASSVKLAEFICCDCGLVESYLDDMNAVPSVKDKCTKVEAKS